MAMLRRAFGDFRLEDEEIEADLGELANMLGGNKLGRQHRRCMCGELGEFGRGDEVAIISRNGRANRRAIGDVAEIRSASESDSGSTNGIHGRSADGWNGEA